MIRRLILACFFMVWALPLGASDFSSAFAGVEPVSDDELSEAQGKFVLPSGIEVAMAVRTDTSVDGALLLRSVFIVNDGPPALSVYAPAVGDRVEQQSGGDAPAAGSGSVGNVSVVVDRASGITMVRTAGGVDAPKVSIGVTTGEALPDGLAQVVLPADGDAVATGGGQVSVQTSDRGARVMLAGDALSVSHLFGQSYGSIVANTANNRAIDTAVNISIELGNVNVTNAGSAAARIDSLALDSLRGLLR